MIFSLVGNWIVGAPFGIYFCEVRGLGITGIWMGLLAGMLVTTLLTLARLAEPEPVVHRPVDRPNRLTPQVRPCSTGVR